MHEEEDGSEAHSCTASRFVNSRSVDVADIEGAKEQASKLCGYLNKLSGKGPLRGYKPKWFVYDPRKCYLYYFKSPQDALPLGHIEICDACFSYDLDGEEGQFEIRTADKEFLLKAPSKQVMHYWLQQLQQKRWEYSNMRGTGQRDSWNSPTLAYPHTGLVGKDNDAFSFEKPCETMEKVRSDFSMDDETEGAGMVGAQTARGPSTNPLNFSLKNFGTELRNSMSHLRGGRRSVFYTSNSPSEEWELVDPPKDFTEQKHHPDTHRHSFGSAFTFDFVRNPSRPKKLLLGSGKLGRSAESSPVECNGSKSLEMQLRLQSQQQQEELSRLQQEEAKLKEELATQKDSLQGYKSQNKFLNKEILELTVLRRNAESREKALEAKCTALEAKLCQVESKYLVLLQEVKNPVCSSSEQSPAREVISRLLEDALQGENTDQQEHTIFKPNTVSEYDVYGFKTVPEEEEEEEKLIAKVRALELKSLSMTDQEVSVGVKWENFLSSTMNRDLVHSPELKALIRCGVPHGHRSKLWRWCVSFHVKKFRDHLPPDYYDTLLNVAREKPNPASKQIELDLLRTLPNNKHYASPSAGGIQKLRNVLLAFSWRNPDIGYCQGLNRLAAIALLYLDQEDAFWTLIAIVEVFMPRDYYTKTLLGSQVDQRVFKDLMSEKLPRLHAHFEQHKVDFSLITFNWFLVVFVDSVVSDILFKIWDAFLFEGPKIIFRFALALFKYKEEEFLKLQDSTAIFKYLRYFTRTILDSRKLMSVAFVDMNPFPMRQIHNRRAFHLEKVRLELTELEAIRQTFLRERETSQDRRSFVSDDEEEN
ncbi:TBC1 domain family member 2B [Neolamprologus brichardi]|nr:TBC1 domain family member 2B [Neolamprologus brichardi]